MSTLQTKILHLDSANIAFNNNKIAIVSNLILSNTDVVSPVSAVLSYNTTSRLIEGNNGISTVYFFSDYSDALDTLLIPSNAIIYTSNSGNVSLNLSQSTTHVIEVGMRRSFINLTFAKSNIDYEILIKTLSSTWDINTAAYNSNSFSVITQDGTASGLYFKPDGTKMFMMGFTNGAVRCYELSDAWNVNSAVYSSNSFSVATQEPTPTDIFFKPDGTKMFILGSTNDAVRSYELSDAWNINSAVYSSNSFSVGGQDASSTGLHFKPDGTKMFVVGTTSDVVRSYELSDAWNINSAVYMSNAINVSVQEGTPGGVFFKPDGTKMFVVGTTSDAVRSYELSDAWNINTAVYMSNSFTVATQETAAAGVFFDPDGTKMFIIGSGGDAVRSYDIGFNKAVLFSNTKISGNNFNIATADTTYSVTIKTLDNGNTYILSDPVRL